MKYGQGELCGRRAARIVLHNAGCAFPSLTIGDGR